MLQICLKKLPLEDICSNFNYDSWYETIVTYGIRPVLPEQFHPKLRDIIEKSLDSNPTNRPTAANICNLLDDVIKQLMISNYTDSSSGTDNSSQSSSQIGITIPTFCIEDNGFELRPSVVSSQAAISENNPNLKEDEQESLVS